MIKQNDRTSENLVMGSPSTPNKISLAGEIAKARQHINLLTPELLFLILAHPVYKM